MPKRQELSEKEVRKARKFSAHFRLGRPSNARRFGGKIYRIHNKVGYKKAEAERVASGLREQGFNVRINSPLIVGDRINFPRKYWVFKRKRVI